MVTRGSSRPASAEERLKELGIQLPSPPEPFGTYAEAVQTGNLLFLTGMLPTEGRVAKLIGRVGAELHVEAGRKAAHLAALNALADAASELLQDVFGKDKNPCRLVYGVASLPLGTPVELEVIFEVSA
jgi:enamine deaminase RidA (YjgF/YER057c/UK114 family)